jgi:hypothetical protein
MGRACQPMSGSGRYCWQNDFLVLERRTVFSHLDRNGNFDSQNRPFGFYYRRISLAGPLLGGLEGAGDLIVDRRAEVAAVNGMAIGLQHLRLPAQAAEELTAGHYADSVRESIHAVESVARVLEPSAVLSKALAELGKRPACTQQRRKLFLRSTDAPATNRVFGSRFLKRRVAVGNRRPIHDRCERAHRQSIGLQKQKCRR